MDCGRVGRSLGGPEPGVIGKSSGKYRFGEPGFEPSVESGCIARSAGARDDQLGEPRMRKAALFLAGCTMMLASLATALAGRAPASTMPGVADPVDFVRAAYAPGARGSGEGPPVDIRESQNPAFSPRLRALFADEERHPDDEIGRLEFNFWTSAQDDEISRLTVEAQDVEGAPDRKVVTARFLNIGQPTVINLFFERIGGRWYLDDASSPGSPGGIGPWTLSLILHYGAI